MSCDNPQGLHRVRSPTAVMSKSRTHPDRTGITASCRASVSTPHFEVAATRSLIRPDYPGGRGQGFGWSGVPQLLGSVAGLAELPSGVGGEAYPYA
jgi:hypothetical protein